MNDIKKLHKIRQFIDDYMEWSQKRGPMYGTIDTLEQNWILLDCIHFILNDLYEERNRFNFSEFLVSKGFGAKNATMIIKERNPKDPYLELNKLWNEYLEWRKLKIDKVLKTRKRE